MVLNPEHEEGVKIPVDGQMIRVDRVVRSFQVFGLESFDGDKLPATGVTDSEGHRYQITDFFELDKDSRQATQELLPDKILISKLVTRKSGGRLIRMR